ncbi:MAG: hypothetical protein WDN66_02110 [Candidatus Saccharibacteria bacterium]
MDTTRVVRVILENSGSVKLEPTVNDQSEFRSEDYAQGPRYGDLFTNWSRSEQQRDDLEGYLVGFPRLLNAADRVVDCLHIWMDNSSITDESYAIPLLSIEGLYVYSKTYSLLMEELDELAQGGRSPRWKSHY